MQTEVSSEDKDKLRVNVEVAKDFIKKNPNDKDLMRWQQEFLEAEKVSVQKKIDDKLSGITKCLYDTDYKSFDEDIRDGEFVDNYIPLHVYSMKPIALSPVELSSMRRSDAKLNEKQKAFCSIMRQRIIVIMSHYANDKDFEEKKSTPICFKLNILPDQPVIEKWIIPSHRPVSIPLYIIRHFGSMTSSKKMSNIEMEERNPDDIINDPDLALNGFTFQHRLKLKGTKSYIQFIRLSTIKRNLKEIHRLVG